MIAIILIAVLVAGIFSAGFIAFFWLKIKHEIDKFDLDLRGDNPTYMRYKNKQK